MLSSEADEQQTYTLYERYFLANHPILHNESNTYDGNDDNTVNSKVLIVDYEDICSKIPGLRAALDSPAASDTLSIINRAAGGGRLVRLNRCTFTPTPIHDLKAARLGHFVSLPLGVVIKCGNPRPMLIRTAWQCMRCGEKNILCDMFDGAYKQPQRCVSVGCMSKLFVVDRKSPMNRCVMWQRICVQQYENANSNNNNNGGFGDMGEGRIPRSIEVELLKDLVNTVTPGALIKASGVLKVDVTEGSSANTGNNSSNNTSGFSVYLEANYIENLTNLQINPIAYNQLSSFVENNRKHLLPIMVNSLIPSIFGHSLVKAALLLCIVGGGSCNVAGGFGNGSSDSIRSNPHLLLIGDPGLGKSQMLTAVAAVSPRGVLVGANTSTSAGLTATLTHESGGGSEFALEAGALVLADNGICCIDEFDKLSDHRPLLDVLEQQCVSIAKAGIVCSLPARTSVVAAANPSNGHYSHRKSVAENIKMDAALLSRFDLIFVLLDKSDQQLDRYLAEKVMQNSSNSSKNEFKNASKIHRLSQLNQEDNRNTENFDDGDVVSKLSKKIAFLPEKHLLVDQLFLRSYLSMVRRHPSPYLSTEAVSTLKQYYHEMRRQARQRNSDQTLPVTLRQLESLIRLSKARARLEMRELVTIEDAEDVIALSKFSLSEIYPSNTEVMNNTNTSKIGKRGKSGFVKRFITDVVNISSKTGQSTFSESQLQQVFDTLQGGNDHCPDLRFSELVDTLNQQGVLLRKPGSLFKLCVT